MYRDSGRVKWLMNGHWWISLFSVITSSSTYHKQFLNNNNYYYQWSNDQLSFSDKCFVTWTNDDYVGTTTAQVFNQRTERSCLCLFGEWVVIGQTHPAKWNYASLKCIFDYIMKPTRELQSGLSTCSDWYIVKYLTAQNESFATKTGFSSETLLSFN